MYLTNKNYKTTVNDYLSKKLIADCGVPIRFTQGPPLNFIRLYTLIAFKMLSITQLNVFSDDTHPISTNSVLEQAIHNMNHKINKLYKFISVNRIRFNENKSLVLYKYECE